MVKCNLCGSKSFLIWEINEYSLYKCESCKVIFLFPIPEFPEKIYNEEYFKRWYIPFYEERKKYFKKLVKKIEKFLPDTGKVFDFGCGIGIFMELMKGRGFETVGYEISPFALNFCKEKGLKVLSNISELNEMENNFDIIFMLDVIAHLKNPTFSLEVCKKMLKKGGILIIKTPFHTSKLFKFAKLFSFIKRGKSILHIPAQIYHFDKESIRNFGKISGFKIKEIFVIPEFLSYRINIFWMLKFILREKSLLAIFEK